MSTFSSWCKSANVHQQFNLEHGFFQISNFCHPNSCREWRRRRQHAQTTDFSGVGTVLWCRAHVPITCNLTIKRHKRTRAMELRPSIIIIIIRVFYITKMVVGGEKNLVRICRLQRSLIPWLPLAFMMVHNVFVFSNRVSMLEFWRIKLPTFYKILPVTITLLSSYNQYLRMYVNDFWLYKVRLFKIGRHTPFVSGKNKHSKNCQFGV